MIVTLYEISWIGSKDPDFLGQLKNAWDLWLSKNSKLVFILCGSVSSWIERNILSSTGFVGRISLDLKLGELPLSDAVEFWGGCTQRIAPYELLKLLAVTGGVPRYLEEILPHLSAEDNVRALCFDRRGLLYREFDQIFSDLFSSRASLYADILRTLASQSATLQDIANAIGKVPSSTVAGYLEDLSQAGLVTQDPTWNLRTMRPSSLKKYRLSDNYVRFYLRYIFPQRERIEKGLFDFGSLAELVGWDTVMGLQFENLVMNNANALFDALSIKASDIVLFGPFFQRKTARTRGCQIDLLIQARYRTLFLCELKFSSDKVGMDAVQAMQSKMERLSIPRGWSVRLALVHVNGVSAQVMQSDALDHVVDFSLLLQPRNVS